MKSFVILSWIGIFYLVKYSIGFEATCIIALAIILANVTSKGLKL